MKKTFSLILVLAMMLSLFTFTASAGTAGYYDVSYEALNVASGDVTKLAVNDTFYAVITLKDAEGLFSGAINLNWDDSVIRPVKTDGTTDSSSFGTAVLSSSRIHNSIKVENEDGDEVAAFEQNTGAYSAGKIEYVFSAAQVDGGFSDYELSGDQLILTVRFRVLKEGDTKLSCTAADVKVCELKADGGSRVATMNVPALKIGGGTEDKWETSAAPEGWTAPAALEGEVRRVAVFGKNATAKALEANSYGVTFGANTYYGGATTTAVNAWAIVLVDTEGDLIKAGHEYTGTAFVGTTEWPVTVSAN